VLGFAPKALFHHSLGQRPRDSITEVSEALKARFKGHHGGQWIEIEPKWREKESRLRR
jgi:hypothetical protein